MVFIPIPDTCRVELRYLVYTQRCENNLSFYKAGGFEPGDLQTIAEHLATWWFTLLRVWQRNTLTLTETYAVDLGDESGPTYTSTLYAGTAGQSTGGSTLPNNCAFAVSFRTAGRGRSYRGRNYCLAIQTGWTSGLQVTSSYRNGILAAYRALLPEGAHDPTPFRWVVGSRYHDNEPRDPGIAIPILAVVVANDDLDSMRRRLAGRGY